MEGRGSDESCFRNPSPETFQEQKAVSKEREGGKEDGKKNGGSYRRAVSSSCRAPPPLTPAPRRGSQRERETPGTVPFDQWLL